MTFKGQIKIDNQLLLATPISLCINLHIQFYSI